VLARSRLYLFDVFKSGPEATNRHRGDPMSDTLIHTTRLDLSPLQVEAVDALLAGDSDRLRRLTGARFLFPAPPPYMAEALPVVRDRLRERPEETHWWNWLVVERETEEAVGSVAFGGPVNAEGAVLVGYAIYNEYEGRGYATEAVKAMVAWAFTQSGVREVRVLAPVWNTPALRVAENVGMRPVASEEDDDVGEVLLYAITAPAFVGSA
jgi:[ribosomal protein S5]-alanine N-acetyltransferase